MATQYYFAVADESFDVQHGTHESPDITISMRERAYLDMVNGKLSGELAFMTGQLRVKGNMGLALKLADLFEGKANGAPDVTSVEQVIEGMPSKFNKGAATGMTAVFQFDLCD